jgi:carbonic anhydrase
VPRPALRSTSCACCAPAPLGRRGLFGLGLATATTGLLRPARAAEGNYDAMLLSCIDPRMVEPVYDWMGSRGLRGQYSQFMIAGAAIAVVAEPFDDWSKAFWENLETSVKLHRIHRIIAVDHRDCGAAKIAYGEARVATPEAETALHREVAAQFRAELHERFPELQVETELMGLDGSVVTFN